MGKKIVIILSLAAVMIAGYLLISFPSSDYQIKIVSANNDAPDSELQLWYRDNHRRQNPTLSDALLNQSGRISNSWLANTYNGFCSVVGVRGEFTIQWNLSITSRGGYNWLQAEWIPYIDYIGSATPVTLTRELDLVNRHGTFSIIFSSVGIYTVSVHTYHGSIEHTNEYEIWVRNGREGPDFDINLTFNTGVHSTIRFTNPLDFVSFSTGIRMTGFRQIETGNISFYKPEDYAFFSVQNTSTNLMNESFKFEEVVGRPDRLQFANVEYAEFPANNYILSLRVRIELEDIDINGEAITRVDFRTITGTVVFRDPPAPTPFPWLTIIIGAVVLLVLGGAFFGSNWLIVRSQESQAARGWRKSIDKEEVDSNNAELLRAQINKERNGEEAYLMAKQFIADYEAELAAEAAKPKDKK